MGLPTALSIGIMTGALTSTPGLAAALEATGDSIASVGYGIAYPFGVLAVVLFVQLLPKILKIDLIKDLDRKSSPIRRSLAPDNMTIEVTEDFVHKRSLEDLNLTEGTSVVFSRVIRGNRTIISLANTLILKGDRLVAVGCKTDLDNLCKKIGREVTTNFDNYDNVQWRKITVEAECIVGKSLRELDLRNKYGVTITRIERGGF